MIFMVFVIGGCIGAIYSLFSERAPEPTITMSLGIAGALVGGFLSRALIVAVTNQAFLGFAILGALALLAIFHLAVGPRD